MACVVTVDTNPGEDFLFESLSSKFKGGGKVVRSRLDVGDVQIEKGSVKLVIERKTWQDMRSSLSDGRYSEQKTRALGSKEEGTEFCYLLEGTCPDWSNTHFIGSRCATVKTSVRDKIPVLNSNGKEDTSHLVAYLVEQVEKGTLYTSSSSSSCAAAKCFKRKRDNLEDPISILRAMLTVIPGMSSQKASSLVGAFSSVDRIRDATEKEISEVKVGERKLGPSLARKLKEVFPSV